MPYKNIEDRRRRDRTFGRRFYQVKKRAKRIGLGVTLTLETYTALIQGATCFYCEGQIESAGGGLDRKNYKQGYHLWNVVPCCRTCNRLKGLLEAKFKPEVVKRILKVVGAGA